MGKSNRDDIIKALEHCKIPRLTKCYGCPREQEDGHCMYRLNEDSLALIKELIEENERIWKANAEWKDLYLKAKKENERKKESDT